MLNINNVAKFMTCFTDGKNQLNFAHVLIKMHSTTDQNMGNKFKPMLVQNFDEHPLVPFKDRVGRSACINFIVGSHEHGYLHYL